MIFQPLNNTGRLCYQKCNSCIKWSLVFPYIIQTLWLLWPDHTCLIFSHSSPQILLCTNIMYSYICTHTHKQTTYNYTLWRFVYLFFKGFSTFIESWPQCQAIFYLELIFNSRFWKLYYSLWRLVDKIQWSWEKKATQIVTSVEYDIRKH